MKFKKICLLLIMFFMIFGIFMVPSSNNINNTNNKNKIVQIENNIKKLGFGNMATLEDGAVYFIRSKANTNKVFDVPDTNYTSNNQIEIYDLLGWGNQRFVLEKSFDNTYKIRPLDTSKHYLSVENNSNSENMKILLRLFGNYNDNTLLTDSFKITYNSAYGGFTIQTAMSNYSKYVGLRDYNTNNKNVLVQKSLDINNIDYFTWIFEKVVTLGVNVDNNENFAAGESKWYLFNVKYSVNYILELRHNSLMTSKASTHQDNSNSTLIEEISNTELGMAYGLKMLISAEAFKTIKIKITNTSNRSGNISIWIYPEKTVLMTTMYDIGMNNIDSATQLLDSIPNLVEAGFYPIVQTNMPLSEALNYGRNGKRLINSKLYFDIHHGNAGGTQFYNGKNSNDQWLDILNMPSFIGTDFVFWGSCKSATDSVNHNGSGYTSNLAYEAVNKGALYSVDLMETLLQLPYHILSIALLTNIQLH